LSCDYSLQVEEYFCNATSNTVYQLNGGLNFKVIIIFRDAFSSSLQFKLPEEFSRSSKSVAY